MTTDDMALLREYAANNSEEAFAALVSRHVNLVYSVALRQVRDPHLAEEIAQAVFIILARKAKSLGDKTVLSGWLCRTARYVSANALTIQRRRQRREQEAYMQSILNEPESDAWRQIAPLLDDALTQLGQKDHDALVLRFFENKSLGEVGTAIGASEDTARMRINRALEKLRKIFTKRGVISTTAIIAGAISTNSVQAAPVGLAKTISVVAIAKGAAASTSTLTLIKGALKIMAWTKMKATIIASAVVLLAAGTTVVVKVINERPLVVQGKTESEWINSIVYNGDDNQRKRWHSLGSIGIKMLVRAMKPPLDELNEEQAITSRKIRMNAADLLGQLGDYKEDTSAVPYVIKLLQTEKDGGVRGLEIGYFEMPIQSMSEKDKTALLPELLHGLNSRDASERNNALVALQYYTNQSNTVIPLIVNALQDSDPVVRMMAVEALDKIDPNDPGNSKSVSVLIGCLTASKAGSPLAASRFQIEASQAATELGELHRDPDLSVPALIQSLQSDDNYVREQSATALGKFGSQAKPAIAALTKALKDSDARVRRQAAAAIKRINSGVPAR
jgi:RNA polymerase sigma factor (sigma-70 family)